MRSVRAAEFLNVVCLGGTREWAREAVLLQRRLAHSLDSRRVGRQAPGMGVVGKAADLDRVLGSPVSGDPLEVQLKRLAQSVESGGDDRLLVDRVIRARGLEEAELPAVGHERSVDAAARRG